MIEATKEDMKMPSKVEYKMQIRWFDTSVLTLVHVLGFYGFYLMIVGQTMIYTVLYTYANMYLCMTGAAAGAHRLWSHRSYKAKWPFRLFLAFYQTMGGQGSIYRWARDHRVHHKWNETNADPYTVSRGLFYSHIGWLLIKRHPENFEKSMYTNSIKYIFNYNTGLVNIKN